MSTEIDFDLGTFEGFNFRTQCAIFGNLTAAEVVEWDHDKNGEAEFWPSGDRPEVALLFNHRNCVSGADLLGLNRLLAELGGDSPEHFLRIHYAVNFCGSSLADLSRDQVEDSPLHIFFGSNFLDVRREAAYELFELYYPDEYAVWEKSLCDGLIFDTDRFLDSPCFFTEETRLGDGAVLLVAPQ
ncbi:MAG: hypothetical protein NT167_31925 [Verrucomicrobia bacterium]|nr:hypothetical protein [Verrucomicrobiota bacterium]